MQRITPFLWFDMNAEEAVSFYVSVFNQAKVVSTSRYGEGGPVPAGTAMTVQFQLEGLNFIALNGGPQFPFTEAISLYVGCENQAEVDDLWTKLTADGGQPSQCGWLKDKYGLSWQIIPQALGTLLSDPDPQKSGRVLEAMLQMSKIDVAALQRAYDGAVR